MIKTPQTTAWQTADAAHHLHPFSDHKALAAKGIRVITKGEGSYLWDSEGNKILDGMAGLWCVNVGYGRHELVRAATEQMSVLPFYNTFFQTSHPKIIELGSLLSEVTPAGFDLAAYCNSGSEANDSIIKFVHYYWKLMGKPNKKTIISRQLAYHGSTTLAASLSGLPSMQVQFDLPLPQICYVDSPYWYGYGGDLSPEEFGLVAARSLEKKILELGVDNIAAFIAEPIQGAGGVIIPPSTYWPEVSRILKQYDILLIADEVICGFGRTGKWFGSDYFNLEPDFMTLAKGITSGYVPLGAIMIGTRVAEAFRNSSEDIAHGFTYSGHPVAAAVAIANINLMKQERIIEKANDDLAPYFQSRLHELEAHPLVGEVRSVGLMAAIELVQHKPSRSYFDPRRGAAIICRDHCINNGLVMRACRDVMVLSPPLVISKGEIDSLVNIAAKCLDLTMIDLNK